MNRPEINIKLTEVFHQVFGPATPVLREDMTAADIKPWDSLNHVTLMYAVEKKFGIRFSTREVQSLKNVGELMAMIEQKTATHAF